MAIVPSESLLSWPRSSKLHISRLALLAAITLPLAAQLTPEQKAIDFQTIASAYAKQYAPYEWKRDNLGFDLFDLRPWMERIRASKDDLAYLEILNEYVAKLNDVHSYYILNSDFAADLHLFTDIYDGKLLIESIDRNYLPARAFDFAIGDEILQMDGRPAAQIIEEIGKMNAFGNARSTGRWAADYVTYRTQGVQPRAAELGKSATLLIRKADGSEKSYTIDWDKSGTPVTKLGPLPNFRLARPAEKRSEEAEEAGEDPSWKKPWIKLQNNIARPSKHLRGFHGRDPIFRLPAAFQQRLGRSRADFYFSGTWTAEGKRIGFIRVGTFDLGSSGLVGIALRQFETEIAFMQSNTDVLIVDVTRNGGGFGCYAETMLTYLMPRNFQTFGSEFRPTLFDIFDWRSMYQDAIDFGTADEQKLYAALLRDIETAYKENRGRTGAMPICQDGFEVAPARDRNGALLAYTKPLLVLTDEFTASAGDIFAALVQDNKRGKIFGYRTAGAGGSTYQLDAGFFSEGAVSMTPTMLVRPEMRSAPGFPASRYIENVGVTPDIVYDYQTRDNLMNNGADFVAAFTKAALDHLAGN